MVSTGQRFALREGGRTVGAGVVSKVISWTMSASAIIFFCWTVPALAQYFSHPLLGKFENWGPYTAISNKTCAWYLLLTCTPHLIWCHEILALCWNNSIFCIWKCRILRHGLIRHRSFLVTLLRIMKFIYNAMLELAWGMPI